MTPQRGQYPPPRQPVREQAYALAVEHCAANSTADRWLTRAVIDVLCDQPDLLRQLADETHGTIQPVAQHEPDGAP